MDLFFVSVKMWQTLAVACMVDLTLFQPIYFTMLINISFPILGYKDVFLNKIHHCTIQQVCIMYISLCHCGLVTPNGVEQLDKKSLQWRHNERDGVSNHRRPDSLLNRLFRRKSKKIFKIHVTGLCEGNSPVTGDFHTQRASNAENVSMWGRIIPYRWWLAQPQVTCGSFKYRRSCPNDMHPSITYIRAYDRFHRGLLLLTCFN